MGRGDGKLDRRRVLRIATGALSLIGHVYRNGPAPTNLVIPLYHYLVDNFTEIAIDP